MILMAGVALVLHPGEIKGASVGEIGIIITDRLNLRPVPGLSKPPLTVLVSGTRVNVLQHLDGWLKVSYGKQIGYVRNRKPYIRIVTDKEAGAKDTFDKRTEHGQIKQKVDDISRKIEEHEQEVVVITQKEKNIINDLNEIDLSINSAMKNVTALRAELGVIEKKLNETKMASQALEQNIRSTEAYAAKRLVALYKLNWLGRLHVLASAESIDKLFQRRAALQRILAYDENMWGNLRADKARLSNLLDRLRAQKIKKAALGVDLENQIVFMSQEREKRTNLLVDIRNKKSLELAAIVSLKEAAMNLDQTITSFKEKILQPVSSAPARVDDGGPDLNNVPTKSFNAFKGLLNMPVNGKITSRFGPNKNNKFNVVNFRSGIDIKSERGEPIRAVSAGRVLYANWFKGYGNMIIIDHGDNYYTIYAHAEELFKSKGDTVETNEVIATVGDSGSMIGPSLYFEVRHHGKPVDPLQWIEKG
jgi:septal ring factor EnvC (AmiA/AmiB activator)